MGQREDTVIVNAEFLDQRIRELDLKIWWIAEQIGIDRGTISRWINGKIRWARLQNIKALAAILECPMEALMVSSETEQPSTKEDLKTAARLIKQKHLKELIQPSGNWQVFESLLKTTLQPNLPANLLGYLYNELTVAAWRQLHIPRAKKYLERAVEISQKNDNQILFLQTQLNLGIIHLFEGRLIEAQSVFASCINKRDDLPSRWAAMANGAEVYFRIGELDESIRLAMELYEERRATEKPQPKPINLCLTKISLFNYYFELGRLEQAKAAIDEAMELAQQNHFHKGIHWGRIKQALLQVRIKPEPQPGADSMARLTIRVYDDGRGMHSNPIH